MLKLVSPSEEYKESYIASLLEEDEKNFPRDVVQQVSDNFSAFIKRQSTIQTGEFKALDGNSYAIDPQYNYWLINEDGFVGDICLRTKLNPFMEVFGGHVGYRIRPSLRRKGFGSRMLALLLKIAKDTHGMDRVMIICSPKNIGSKGMIEKNNGHFEKTNTYIWTEAKMDVYWIDLLEGK